jgi:transposase
MAKRACWREIPTELSLERFEEFILPHLTVGKRGPAPKLSLHVLFNYILKLLYLGCQWKELPIEKDATGRREIHHIRIWRTFRRWVADGCFNAIFEGAVLALHQAELLDISIIHGDGTTTAAKKGRDKPRQLLSPQQAARTASLSKLRDHSGSNFSDKTAFSCYNVRRS